LLGFSAGTHPLQILQSKDWPLQGSATWSSIFGFALGKHLRGAPDVQSHSHEPGLLTISEPICYTFLELSFKCFKIIESLNWMMGKFAGKPYIWW
jgi:hypothetical protein